MDQDTVKKMSERVANMRGELEALMELGGEFPALTRNAARITASLSMIEINLGQSVIDVRAK